MSKLLRQRVIKLDLGEAWHTLETVSAEFRSLPIYTVVQRKFEVLGLLLLTSLQAKTRKSE